jgi:hypothetical protein
MSERNPIRVYVTHTFSEDPDYRRVFEYLESLQNFFYVNCSNIESIPGGGGKEAVKNEFRTQIKMAEVVIVPSIMFANHRSWITYQMDVAQAMNLPIVAMEPFGGTQEMPKEVSERADERVEWNDRLLVDALRRQARHEETTRWETIEFEMP